MIVQSGHHFFGSAGNPELKEPKAFLAQLRETFETNMFTSTTTNIPEVSPIIEDHYVEPSPQELETEIRSRIFGDKKVSTFYLHMSIAISFFIVLIVIGVSAYYCYKRREFQNMDHTQHPMPRRRNSAPSSRRRSSQQGSEKQPINQR